jgi:signal transduction histidine kinase
MVIGLVIGLIISLYACISISRSILKPIHSLTEATRALGEGNQPQPLALVSNDEFGQLAGAFNKMAAQLQEYRQSTSEQIVQLHHTMETTLASFPDPIFVLNKAGEVELKNPAAEELLASQNASSDWSKRLNIIVQKTFLTGESFLPHGFEEGISYRANGMDKFFLPRVVAMRSSKNGLASVAVVLYDVTRFRLMDAAKTNLVATVSHELKTPLTSVRMALYMLLEKTFGPLTAKQEELLETGRNDSDRLLRILNDLLDLARLEQGYADLRKEKVAPAVLLEEIAHEMADQIASKGLALQSSVAPGLPIVVVDRQRIKYVFANLITNAVKFSPPGGKITFQAVPGENGEVEFSVTDQGPGIRNEYHVRIFERFFRVPEGNKPGAGLGLSIAKEITVAHGGRIGVRNASGAGSTFFVSIKGDAATA